MAGVGYDWRMPYGQRQAALDLTIGVVGAADLVERIMLSGAATSGAATSATTTAGATTAGAATAISGAGTGTGNNGQVAGDGKGAEAGGRYCPSAARSVPAGIGPGHGEEGVVGFRRPYRDARALVPERPDADPGFRAYGGEVLGVGA